MNLTNEEIRIKIAESLGWAVQFNEKKQLYELLTPAGKWEYPFDADGGEEHCWTYAPNYPESLDACSQFEATLTDVEFEDYFCAIESQVPFARPQTKRRHVCSASAKDRCLAYLQTKGIE